MHRLDRANCPPPACLERYHPGCNHWDDLTPNDRAEIRSCLEQMQGKRCAYCEGDLETLGNHIEHFRQRARFETDTFAWTNLFWSCYQEDSCGRHKDRCEYQHTDLIKPDEEDPETFFLFASDGTIALRANLHAAERQRAAETLRIFNLDAQWGRLRHMRRAMASSYVKTADEIREIAASYPPEDWMPFLEAELSSTRDLPFCTTIKHVLTPQGVGR